MKLLKQTRDAGQLDDPVLEKMLLYGSRNMGTGLFKYIDRKTKLPALVNNSRAVLDPLFTQFPEEYAKGNYAIGPYAYNQELKFMLSLDDFIMGIVSGPSGCGKSRGLMGPMLAIINSSLNDGNIAIITPKEGSEWRNLMPFSKNLVYFTKNNFYFNPLEEIEKVSIQDNARNFVSVFVSEQRFMEGVASYLYNCIIQLKKKNPYCNIFDLVKYLESRNEKSTSEKEYNSKAKNRLLMISESLRPMMDVVKGIRLEDLATKQWCLELVTHSESTFNTIVSWLLSRLYLWKTSNS